VPVTPGSSVYRGREHLVSYCGGRTGEQSILGGYQELESPSITSVSPTGNPVNKPAGRNASTYVARALSELIRAPVSRARKALVHCNYNQVKTNAILKRKKLVQCYGQEDRRIVV